MANKRKANTSWGGSRKGAGRKPKTPPPSEYVPGPGEGFYISAKDTTKGATPTPGNNNHWFTEAQRKLREDVEAMFKMGKALKCPDSLDDDARDEWNRLMACYAAQESDILCTLDITMLRLFCESKGRYAKAYRTWTDLLQSKIIVDNERVQKMIDKCFKVMDKETMTMKALAPDLCLTISGRAKAGLLAAKADQEQESAAADQLMAFFGSGSGGDDE